MAAGYQGAGDPAEIIVVRNGVARRVNVKDLLGGQDVRWSRVTWSNSSRPHSRPRRHPGMLPLPACNASHIALFADAAGWATRRTLIWRRAAEVCQQAAPKGLDISMSPGRSETRLSA